MSAPAPPSTDDAARPRPRRRVSRRRYAMRRLGALLVVGAVAFAAVRVAAAVVGDDGAPGAADDGSRAPATDASEPAAAPVAGDVGEEGAGGGGAEVGEVDGIAPVTVEPAATTPAADATVPSTVPSTESAAEAGPPSQANPAEVYIVGDSDAGTFGPYLQRLLDGTLIVDTELNYKVSSGLARPDFFDWPSELRRLLPEVAPDIVVVTFGGNDGQPLTEPDGTPITGLPENDTADWTAEYQRRAGDVMDLLLEDDRTVIWVGIPNDDNPEVTARMSIQDQAAKAAAAERPDVVFVDTWTRFSGRDGGWAEFVIDPRDGQGKDVRASDGFHLNEVGAEILALDIAQAIRDDLRARGANI